MERCGKEEQGSSYGCAGILLSREFLGVLGDEMSVYEIFPTGQVVAGGSARLREAHAATRGGALAVARGLARPGDAQPEGRGADAFSD